MNTDKYGRPLSATLGTFTERQARNRRLAQERPKEEEEMINEAEFIVVRPSTDAMRMVDGTPIYWREDNLRDAVFAHLRDWTGRTPDAVQVRSPTSGALSLDGVDFEFRIGDI